MLLATMRPPAYPMAIGVLYNDPAPSFEVQVETQIEEARTGRTLNELLHSGRTWTVAG